MLPFLDAAQIPFLSSIPPVVVFTLLVLLLIWTTVIKAFALWYAARNGQVFWFVALLILNSVGILELVYLLAFRKDKQGFASQEAKVASDATTA